MVDLAVKQDREQAYLANLRERVVMAQNCREDKRARAAAIEMLERPDGILSFFRYWIFTYDPRKKPPERPFVPYDYQTPKILEINQNIIDGVDELDEKSRDMGLTWIILGTFAYRWLVHHENFLCGSRKEELVDKIGDMDTHFERIRFILKHLPDWMVEYYGWDRRNNGFLKLFKDNGASIVGESMSPDFSRQGRYNAIFLDEFAFVDHAELIWRSCGESSPCKLVVSTPNGKNNKFAKLRDSGQIKVRTTHWRQHPEKDEDWYAEKVKNRTAKDVAQELDINYSVSAGESFYKGFVRALHVRKMHLNKSRPLELSWDFGFAHPNCSVHQMSSEGIWIIVDNIFGEDLIIDEFADIVTEYLNTNYEGFSFRERGYGDPAGLQRGDKSKKTSVQILKEKGYPVRTVPSNLPTTNYTARKNIIERKLKTLIDGCPALVVNDTPNNSIIIEAFEGGYHFPKANTVGMVVEKPEEDSYYEHPMNTVEYVAINKFNAKKLTDPAPGVVHRYTTFRSKGYSQPTVNAGFGFKK